jgi:hypothetical protein
VVLLVLAVLSLHGAAEVVVVKKDVLVVAVVVPLELLHYHQDQLVQIMMIQMLVLVEHLQVVTTVEVEEDIVEFLLVI